MKKNGNDSKIRLSARSKRNSILGAKHKIKKMTKNKKRFNDFVLDKVMDDIESWR